MIAAKFKEVLFSVLPITIIVLILNFTISPMDKILMLRFLMGILLVVLGLTIFLLGVDIGITPLGALTGASLAKTNKLWLVLTAALILGFFISIAEPGLMVLANQVDLITSGQIPGSSILLVVSSGLAIMLAFGFLRIIYNLPLSTVLIFLYLIIFVLAIFSSREFLAISFDASGSTTGILAVPFILSLAAGISRLKKDSKASEKDSFGLVAIASTGAIMAVLLLDIFFNIQGFSGDFAVEIFHSQSVFRPFSELILACLTESFVVILPLLVTLLVLQKIFFHLKQRELRQLLTGFAFVFTGLWVFLIGVRAGIMDVGTSIGSNLALLENKAYILIVAFVLGFATILTEPAVYVLTQQIEEVSSGYLKRKVVLIPLAVGVGLAVALSVLRVLVPVIQLWHYLLPGYLISLTLMFFIPKLFVGIAFDAGGVATGPMTATFILAFIQGAAQALEGADLILDGFGMIALVATMPIITLEFLGLVLASKSKRKGVEQWQISN